MTVTPMTTDVVRLVDGPLANRRFTFEETPTEIQCFHAAVSWDGVVIAVEGDPAPVGIPFRGVAFNYAPVIAADGIQSRADDGCLLFFLVEEETQHERPES